MRLRINAVAALLALLAFGLSAAFAADIQYAYDAAGRLVGVVDQNGNAARYNYDANGNVTSIDRFSTGSVAIFSFVPTKGVPGTEVTVSGIGFSATASQNTVKFNGTVATIVSASANRITAVVPSGATTGPVSVTSPSGTAQSSGQFTVLVPPPPPVVTGFSPTYGGAGDSFTVTGSSFATSPLEEKLTIGGGLAGIASSSTTTISATVAETSRSGNVAVTTSGGTGTSTSSFTVLSGGYTGSQVGSISAASIGSPTLVSASDGTKVYVLNFEGAAGQRVSLAITGQTVPSAQTTIYGPDGAVVGGPYSSGAGSTYFSSITLPSAGTYQAIFVPQSNGTGSATITIQPDVVGTISPGGSAVTVTIGTAGQNATLTFSGNAGQRISLGTSDSTISVGTLRVYRPSGPQLASLTISTGSDFLDTQTLPETGVYTVEIDPSEARTGSITLTLYDVPADIAGTIVAGGSPVTVTIGTPGQNANLTFSGTVGQRISLDTSNSTLGVGSVRIYKPSGPQLASLTVGLGSAFMDVQTLPETGIYRLEVDPLEGRTGSITLTLYDVPADIAGSIVPGGTSVTVTIGTPGQNANLTFSGTSGQRISLGTSNSTITAASIRVYKPSGPQFASLTVGTSAGFMDVQTLLETGIYRVEVDPVGGRTGSITLTLHDVPPDPAGTLIVNGAAMQITISTPGQNARPTFDGVTAQAITVQANSNTIGSLVVKVIRADGTTVVGSKTTSASSFTLAVSLPATETYTVLVDPLVAATGTINIAITSP